MKVMTQDETVAWFNRFAVAVLRGEQVPVVDPGQFAMREDLEYAADRFRERFVNAFSDLPDKVFARLPEEARTEESLAALRTGLADLEVVIERATEAIKDQLSLR